MLANMATRQPNAPVRRFITSAPPLPSVTRNSAGRPCAVRGKLEDMRPNRHFGPTAQRHGRRADSFTSQINNGLGPQRSTTRERAPIQADARSLRRLPRTTTRYVPGGKVPTPVVENVAGAPADEQK